MTESPDQESAGLDERPDAPDQAPGERCRVAVFAVPDDREPLIPVLTEIPGISAIDARVRLQNLPGLLPERLERETAERIVREFQSAGVNAAMFDDADVPRLERRPAPHHVRCTDAGLEFVGTGGTTQGVLPWPELSLVSIAEVPSERRHHDIAAPSTLIFSAPGVHGSDTVAKGAHGPEMWLVREAPFEAWRIDHLEMNYEYLAERLSTSAAANFRVFATELADHARTAYFTPSARAFLQTRRVEEYRFASRDAHAKAVQLHVLLLRTMRNAP